jgi:hypothetical protein
MNTSPLIVLSWIVMIAVHLTRAHYHGSEAAEAFWNYWFRRETGVLDRTEAVMWLPVIFLNWRMFLISLRQKRWSMVTAWFLIMGLGTIVLFGEEISWGQSVFGWKPGDEMMKINAQHETNFHNLNLSLLMGLTPDDTMYRYFKNANYLLNPAYYLASCVLFIGLPILKRIRMLPIIGEVPMPNMRIVVFFFASVLAYLFVDKLLWDVGEVFEFSITTTFLLTGLDQLAQLQAKSVPVSRANAPSTPSRGSVRAASV